jgi:hypothetical protein
MWMNYKLNQKSKQGKYMVTKYKHDTKWNMIFIRFLELSRDHHTNNRTPQAMYLLKKKKQVEDILDRRLKTLETMDTMLLKIEASQNDLQVMK